MGAALGGRSAGAPGLPCLALGQRPRCSQEPELGFKSQICRILILWTSRLNSLSLSYLTWEMRITIFIKSVGQGLAHSISPRNDGQLSCLVLAVLFWGGKKTGCAFYPMDGNVKDSARVEKPRKEGVEIWILSLKEVVPSTACQLLRVPSRPPSPGPNLHLRRALCPPPPQLGAVI